MTDNQLTTRAAFIRDLQRNERLDVAVTVIWSTVALLAVVLIFAWQRTSPCQLCANRLRYRGPAATRSRLRWPIFRLRAEIGTAGAQQQSFDLLN